MTDEPAMLDGYGPIPNTSHHKRTAELDFTHRQARPRAQSGAGEVAGYRRRRTSQDQDVRKGA